MLPLFRKLFFLCNSLLFMAETSTKSVSTSQSYGAKKKRAIAPPFLALAHVQILPLYYFAPLNLF